MDLSASASVDEDRMRLALLEARIAAERGEVPVGCVLVAPDGAVVAKAHNLRETLNDPTAHAEMLALRWAAQDRGSWRLDDLTAYVTLEPCPMCAGALVHARVARVVYACDDPKSGAVRSMFGIGQDERLNHRFALTTAVLAEPCSRLLRAFFADLRARKKAEK